MDERKEIHPCALQDIGPLGPLPKKVIFLQNERKSRRLKKKQEKSIFKFRKKFRKKNKKVQQ